MAFLSIKGLLAVDVKWPKFAQNFDKTLNKTFKFKTNDF